jgi:7-carboxy-7-deazaguanine synthase (Cx14CxxC type)
MAYAVKEIFFSLQGEGANTGRPAVFCRFAGCNLWSGREEDRATAACRFCDTDFFGVDGRDGGTFASAERLATVIRDSWPTDASQFRRPLVVFTGGEPALQVDSALVDATRGNGFELAIETNGTVALTPGIDWVCVSPKAGTELVVRRGNELKLVHPQAGAEPERFIRLAFDHFYLQPMDGPRVRENTRAVVEYCLANPPWRVGLQTHKLLGIR